MGLPKPTFVFTIPSVHDDLALDCRLYIPPSDPHEELHPPSPPLKGAIIAHPYAPLGGSYDNPVISYVGAQLLHHGWTVGTFNFRGAGGSKGKTTWSGQAELDDYISMSGFMVAFLTLLESSESPSAAAPHICLLLAGYSYGSLIVRHLPPTPTLLSRFTLPVAGTAASEIRLRASHLAHEAAALTPSPAPSPSKKHRAYGHQLSVSMGGEETRGSARRRSRESHRVSLESLPGKLRELSVRRRREHTEQAEHMEKNEPEKEGQYLDVVITQTLYLLISPILAPLSTALAYGLRGTRMPSTLEKNPTLVIYGDRDFFTSAKRLEQWTAAPVGGSAGMLRRHVIEDAGHFWAEDGVMSTMSVVVGEWIEGLEGLNERGNGI